MTYKVYLEGEVPVVKQETDPDAYVGEIFSRNENEKIVVECVYVEAGNAEDAIAKAKELAHHQP